MYHSETEEQDEHDDPPLPATTSNTRRSFPVPKYHERHLEPEPTSDSKLPGPVKDDKPPGGNREHHGIGETNFDKRKRYLEIKTFLSELPNHSEPKSPELPDHFDFRPDTSSSGSNPADHEPIPNERKEGFLKFCIDEFEDLEDYMKVYAQYRIAGGRMKFKSDIGNELYYARFPGIEFDEVGDWSEDRNNIAPCEWTMSEKEYVEWFHSNHPRPVDIRQATRFWLDRREML